MLFCVLLNIFNSYNIHLAGNSPFVLVCPYHSFTISILGDEGQAVMQGGCKKTELNDSRKIICLRKSEVSVERIGKMKEHYLF